MKLSRDKLDLSRDKSTWCKTAVNPRAAKIALSRYALELLLLLGVMQLLTLEKACTCISERTDLIYHCLTLSLTYSEIPAGCSVVFKFR